MLLLLLKTSYKINMDYKWKMFWECLKAYNQCDVCESVFYKKTLDINFSPRLRHYLNIIIGCIVAIYTVFKHGLALWGGIFIKKRKYYPYVELVITTKCTLRCENCANLMQYYDSPYMLDVNELKKTIDSFMKYVDGEVVVFRLIGGEPFLFQRLDEIVLCLYKYKKIYRYGIPSNGTVNIKEKIELLNVLSNKKMTIDVSDYSIGNVKEFCEILKAFNINYSCTKHKWWFEVGEITKKNRDKRLLNKQFGKCFLKCRTILNNSLYQCPRSSHGEDLGLIPYCETDSYNLECECDARKREALAIFYYREDYIEACDYCDYGIDTLQRTVKAGVQKKK